MGAESLYLCGAYYLSKRLMVGEDDEFAHIQRKRDDRFGHDVAILLPGDYCASREPIVMYTMLGSCVSACIRDPLAGLGGMNHFLLPEPGHPPCERDGEGWRLAFPVWMLCHGTADRVADSTWRIT